MTATRVVGCLFAAGVSIGISVWTLAAAEPKKKKEYAGDTVTGTITQIKKDFEFADPDDPKKILLRGTKIEVKTKAKNGKVGRPFVVAPDGLKPEFQTDDKELAVGQYARIWFNNGENNPDKQGEATKIVVMEDPAKKKKKAN